MEQLLKKKRIYQVPVQPQTMEQWEEDLELKRTRWGKYFTNTEQFEYFAMLPLDETQRQILINAMIAEQEYKRELENCTGKLGSSSQHKRECLPCCVAEKIAQLEV